ncbi:response regulator [Oscillospiraceae bacterium PP1C4]
MYSVLIIDDEEPVREAVKLLCNWDAMNITQIFEACNGKTALEFVNKRNIDLVILDMNMPEMDGIEFLRHAEEKQFEVIVISGFDNFEYAYEALKYRAVDYLLKPLIKSKLNEAVKKAVDKLSETKNQRDGLLEINNMLNITLPVLKERIYLAAIEGMLSQTEKEVYASIINPNSVYKSFGVIILRILYPLEAKYRTEKNLESVERTLKSIVEDLNSSTIYCFYLKNPIINDERAVVLNLSSDVNTDDVTALKMQFDKMLRCLKASLGITVVSEISCLQNNVIKLNESYSSAKRKLKIVNLLDIYCCKTNLHYLPNQTIAKSLIVNLPLFQNAIEKGSFKYLQDQLDEYLKQFIDIGYFSLEDADRMIAELELMLRDIAIQNDFSQSEAVEISSSIPISYSSFEEFKKLIGKIATNYYTEIRKQIKNKDSFEVCEIKKYIDHKYFEKINISIFSKKYYLSREYIMKLFKKEFGCGIYEYVLKIRMTNAKKLICDPHVKIQDVAQMVGYNDSNYFSKAFRNYYGMSPTIYKESLDYLHKIN